MVSGIGAAFDLPPKEAVDFFRSKGFQFAFDWTEMLKQEHDANFTVAKITDLDLLKEIRDAVDQAISEGTTFDTFKERLIPRLQESGWWGGKMVLDADTGEEKEVQLGSPRRLRTIFETNLKTAYAAGRWEQIQDTKADFPYLMYDAVKDDRTREEHLAWDGLVLPADDPWWKTHYPPNGWNCRCSVIQVNDRTLGKLGKDGPDEAPPIETRPWVNPTTGEEEDVPEGIDPGWDYAPGMSRVAESAMILEDRLINAEPDIGSAVMGSMTDEATQALDDEFSLWAENIMKTKMKSPDYRVVGAIDEEVLAALKEIDVEPASSPILTTAERIVHLAREDKDSRDQTIPPEAVKGMRELFRNPKAVLFDLQEPALIYVFDVEEPGKIGKTVVRVGFHDWIREKDERKKKRVGNFVRTAGVVQTENLTSSRYRALKGKV